MTAVANFPSFIPSYKQLKENEHKQFSIAFYHHDCGSEPTIHISDYAESIRLDDDEEYGKIIEIHTPETFMTFTEKNHLTNLSNDDVVFSSKHDDETYWIIEFKS